MTILTQHDLQVIRQTVAQMIDERYINSMGGASCGVTCEEIAARLNWQMSYGSIRSDTCLLIDDDHAWLIAPDGTIVDPTIQQFSGQLSH